MVSDRHSELFVSSCTCEASKKLKSGPETSESEPSNCDNGATEKKLSRQDRIELGRMFHAAVGCHNWELAESLIVLADPQILNYSLCISLDSVWFLSTEEDLTSFLASRVSVCRSRTTSLADSVSIMAARLHERRLQECNGDEVLKAEAGAKVQKFTEWAFKCIGFHSHCQNGRDDINQNSPIQTQLQLSTFKTFLDLAGNKLSGKDFTEAFDAACFPLTLFSSSFDPGWSSGVSATAILGLLSILVDEGADNVNQCFLEASRFGSTELVRILLQIAQRNSLDVDVDLALGFASHYGKIGTMECLVEEGNAITFLGPLMRAAERGCLHVVQWFVKRGCRDMELCLALTAATSSSQVEIAAYLLPHVSHHVLVALGPEILKAAGARSNGSLDGVAFLLNSNFLGDPMSTYAVAESICKSDDDCIAPQLRDFLREHWSEDAFLDGLRKGQENYLNLTRILKWGESPICLGDLPSSLRVAIAYLPLYRECVEASGCLLSQRLRGELVEAARRLGGMNAKNMSTTAKQIGNSSNINGGGGGNGGRISGSTSNEAVRLRSKNNDCNVK
ncbi:Ankyrin repeat protein SKIP35 [Heracleum sosnowskyi]|uniref:Ankyrin repeat protein SKIP35 n=1 Tax=Heracleum sosnowskyi TaxID=360622 RepID=A0AAD8I6N0_9APIA|nr:Ankyrin repeat protein SKIP35 [Heracleum sosnowskyi]